ncbi:MAG: hypothetical protein ABR915_06345 [Thermoguttaceae bacterium]|jgi:hypothetical protein
MNDQPNLSEQEWALVIELLQRELDELPVEIHHCRVASFREDLHHRLTMVQRLLEQLHAPITV